MSSVKDAGKSIEGKRMMQKRNKKNGRFVLVYRSDMYRSDEKSLPKIIYASNNKSKLMTNVNIKRLFQGVDKCDYPTSSLLNYFINCHKHLRFIDLGDLKTNPMIDSAIRFFAQSENYPKFEELIRKFGYDILDSRESSFKWITFKA